MILYDLKLFRLRSLRIVDENIPYLVTNINEVFSRLYRFFRTAARTALSSSDIMTEKRLDLGVSITYNSSSFLEVSGLYSLVRAYFCRRLIIKRDISVIAVTILIVISASTRASACSLIPLS